MLFRSQLAEGVARYPGMHCRQHTDADVVDVKAIAAGDLVRLPRRQPGGLRQPAGVGRTVHSCARAQGDGGRVHAVVEVRVRDQDGVAARDVLAQHGLVRRHAPEIGLDKAWTCQEGVHDQGCISQLKFESGVAKPLYHNVLSVVM